MLFISFKTFLQS